MVSTNDAHIAGLGISVPRSYSTDRFIEIDRLMRERHGHSPEVHELAAKFARNTGIVRRHSMHPLLHQDADDTEHPDILTETDYDPELWQRMAFFVEHSQKMAVEAARAALLDWGGPKEQITHIITTGTSGWKEPGTACAVIDGLGLADDTQKAELNFNGCFCGATCLRLARDTVRAGESGAVLVVAMEASSTLFDFVDSKISSLLANALFGDGAAAVIIAPQGRWRFVKAGMSLIPETRQMLRFAPPTTPGKQTYEMYLHRKVGARIARYLRDEKGRALMDEILEWSGEQPPELAVHPGGPNILEAVQAVFEERGWPADCLTSSYRTLHNYGNMGSAAMLFVLANTLHELQTDRLTSLAFGPGITVEWGRWERVTQM